MPEPGVAHAPSPSRTLDPYYTREPNPSGMYITTDETEACPADGWEDVEKQVERIFEGDGDEFVVLEEDPEAGDRYVQASLWTKGVLLGASYLVEARRPEGEGFTHWRLKTKRTEEVVQAFRDYFEGRDPVGPKWMDVTDEFTDS